LGDGAASHTIKDKMKVHFIEGRIVNFSFSFDRRSTVIHDTKKMLGHPYYLS
jgi:hypothetical protein